MSSEKFGLVFKWCQNYLLLIQVGELLVGAKTLTSFQLRPGVDSMSMVPSFVIDLPFEPLKSKVSPCSKFIAVLGKVYISMSDLHQK